MAQTTALPQSESKTRRTPRRPDPRMIQAAVEEALCLAGYGELRRVEVECNGDAVTIAGRVPTYYLKQLAQSVALDIPGIKNIRNELHVC